MIVGCLIYLFAVLLNKVSLEYTVKCAVGLSAVLNCSYTADTNKVDKVDWVYNHTDIVYAFSPSSPQPFNEKFQTIPQDFPNGNYALKIKKVEITDEGMYTCIITPADYYTNLQLVVEESHKGTKKDDPDKGNQKPSDVCTTVCVVLVVLVVLVFVGILLFVCIKKGCVGHIRKLYASHCLRSAY